jgi:hypothetical protein
VQCERSPRGVLGGSESLQKQEGMSVRKSFPCCRARLTTEFRDGHHSQGSLDGPGTSSGGGLHFNKWKRVPEETE